MITFSEVVLVAAVAIRISAESTDTGGSFEVELAVAVRAQKLIFDAAITGFSHAHGGKRCNRHNVFIV